MLHSLGLLNAILMGLLVLVCGNNNAISASAVACCFLRSLASCALLVIASSKVSRLHVITSLLKRTVVGMIL